MRARTAATGSHEPRDPRPVPTAGRSSRVSDSVTEVEPLLHGSLSESLAESQEELGGDQDGPVGSAAAGPEVNPKRLRRRLLGLATLGVVVAIVLLTGPGLGKVRRSAEHASVGWLILGVGLEALSALSYVVIFRAVFCPRMRWRLSYQFGMSEQGANSVISVSGAGGLALGAWALSRGGMSTEEIGRKSVALFFLTSLPNVGGVIAFAALYAADAIQ